MATRPIWRLTATQTTSKAKERTIQTMGSIGLTHEAHLERLWRDSRLFRCSPNFEEMILNFIAMHDLSMQRGYLADSVRKKFPQPVRLAAPPSTVTMVPLT
jgi:hypothetical protein